MPRSPLRLSLLVLIVGALAAACGGGGGSPVVAPRVEGIQSPDVDALSPTYRAVFACRARANVPAFPAGIDVTGTLTIENSGEIVTSPLDGSRSGSRVVTTLVLVVPTVVRLQAPQLPPTITVSYAEIIEVDMDGAWYLLGRETTDPRVGIDESYRSWAASPILLQAPQMIAGQTVGNPPTDVLADDLVTVLAVRQLTRTFAGETEALSTVLGRLECHVVTEEDRYTDLGDLPGPYALDSTRWERPDLGPLRIEYESFTYEGEFEGEPISVTLRDIVCELESLQP